MPVNKYVILAIGILLGLLVALFFSVRKLSAENAMYKRNMDAFIDSIECYKVSDSLNAAHINELQLSLSEYKRYRAEDAELIKKLKADKIEALSKVKTETKVIIKTELKDSIVYKDTTKAINYTSKWIDLHGFILDDTLQLSITNYEELLLVESMQRKKFLFIKLPVWLFGYKNCTVDVVSKNPNTKIRSAEHIKVR